VDGTCKELNLCSGVVCTPPDLCHLAGACDPATGNCGTPPPKTCPPNQGCNPANGSCEDLCVGVTCTTPDLCHTAGTCNSTTGTCSTPVPVSCPSGQSCDPADGACKTLVARAQAAKELDIVPPAAVAFDAAGQAYVSGSITPPIRIFDGHPVSSAGGSDVFLARYDSVTKSNVWAESFGDAAEQAAVGVAATQDGTVAAIGGFFGTLKFGSQTVSSPGNTIDFLGAVAAADGSGKWVHSFNDGSNGLLIAIAANPNKNLIAVCGSASQAATDLVPGASFGGGNTDVVIAVFESSGALRWAKQIGGANDEECDALAVDDNGDVLAAGIYNGALSFTGPPLPPPASQTTHWMWMARFNGQSGSALAQASFGSGAGSKKPAALAADATGTAYVTGAFTTTLPFGGTTLTSAGGSDAFVARLDPASSFAPLWAVRLGGTGSDEGHGIAVDAAGNAVVVGDFTGTTSGAAVMTGAGSTDAFLLELDGSTGNTLLASHFGDSAQQIGDRVAIDRLGGSIVFCGSFSGNVDFGGPTLSVAPTVTEAFLVFARPGQ
jgi:hypothetical protein